MRLDLASGWQLEIAIERDQLGALLWARATDGRDWEFGCQRDDWTLGPDSRIVEPVALLHPEQRHQLERLLRDAICWPEPPLSSVLVVASGLWEIAEQRTRWRQSSRSHPRRRITAEEHCIQTRSRQSR
jgi:hypothetical protein